MMELTELFERISRTAIRVDLSPDGGEAAIGASKIGGRPDLPQGFKWYYYRTHDVDNVPDSEEPERPLSFLAQIRCEDIQALDKENVLPREGMLYFFYELASMEWGFDPKDEGCARAYYYDGPAETLTRAAFPEDLDLEYQLPEIPLSFHTQVELPDYEEFSEDYPDCGILDGEEPWEEYDNRRAEWTGDDTVDSDCIIKLLGYPDIIQSDMRDECESVSRGMYSGGPREMTQDEYAGVERDARQWRLLFQFDTLERGGFELAFGDGGRIYFWIREQDLKNRDFDRVWLILQCY